MLRELHEELGIPGDYELNDARPAFEEAAELVEVGPNIVGRMQRLAPEAAASWAAMQAEAAAAGVTLLLVSGYRSIDYQARLFRKKINAGQCVSEILTVNAAPGFSEHHTGRAVDIATPGSRPTTTTPASRRNSSASWPSAPSGITRRPATSCSRSIT